jgi:hypothetical protein
VTDRGRRAAVLLVPVLLVMAGLFARRMGAGALRAFIHYQTPFALPPGPARTGPPLSRQVVLVLVDGLGLVSAETAKAENRRRTRDDDGPSSASGAE